ncbi:hypothetical protein CPB85DRAFT_172588 [Mucidula mucida]|nr:hypothetical protein CPB85DRAFT_172588 [Mucidula mucida]
MHSAVSFRTIPRTIHFGFRSWVKSRVSDRTKDEEEFCILESTFGDISYPLSSSSTYSPPLTAKLQDLSCQATTPPSHLGAPSTPYLILRDSPLASLEIALLCTAQEIAVLPEESQAAVLRTVAVPASKATFVKIDEPLVVEAQSAIIDTVADAPPPSLSITIPTLKKNDTKPPSPLLPVQNITSFIGNLRPSGHWDGKKRAPCKQDENLAPARKEELKKEYIPRAYPSRPMMYRRGAFTKHA